MESVVVKPDFWNGRKVLVTGHTGFKGAWLCQWLTLLGARVSGFARAPRGDLNLWTLVDNGEVRDHRGNICDLNVLESVLSEERPEIIFHLAAQSLVRSSYRDPIETFETNVMGVVKLLDAVRRAPSVRSLVNVTSDKCYENVEQIWGYRENDPMGGRDPYSASKGCSELVTASMRRSFFRPYAEGVQSSCRIATARAGNVIGGGDWSEDRLVPDIVRGCLGEEQTVEIRSPHSLRPWQHVLEPLRGYLMLAEQLTEGTVSADEGWNFGPDRHDERPVIEVARAIVAALGRGTINVSEVPQNFHEAKLLRLDSSKARQLGWQPRLSFDETVAMTARWYGKWAAGEGAADLCTTQISEYMKVI